MQPCFKDQLQTACVLDDRRKHAVQLLNTRKLCAPERLPVTFMNVLMKNTAQTAVIITSAVKHTKLSTM